MKPYRYILQPGTVTSQSDGQRHYVGASALARLYGVDIRACYIDIGDPCRTNPPIPDHLRDLPVLAPREDGNYTLPETP